MKRRHRPRRDDRHTGNSPPSRFAHRPKTHEPSVDPTPHRKRIVKQERNYGFRIKWAYGSGWCESWYATARQRDQAFDARVKQERSWSRYTKKPMQPIEKMERK